MPSKEEMEARSNARKLRREQNSERTSDAHSQVAETGIKALNAVEAAAPEPDNQTQAQPAVQASTPAAAETRPVADARPKKSQSRAQQTQAQRRQAEAQAQREAVVVPQPVDIEQGFERWNGSGSPPLHLLNAIAIEQDTELRDEGREIAKSAAKGAYDTYIGKVEGKRNRHAKMRAAIAAAETARAVAAAKANTE